MLEHMLTGFIKQGTLAIVRPNGKVIRVGRSTEPSEPEIIPRPHPQTEFGRIESGRSIELDFMSV